MMKVLTINEYIDRQREAHAYNEENALENLEKLFKYKELALTEVKPEMLGPYYDGKFINHNHPAYYECLDKVLFTGYEIINWNKTTEKFTFKRFGSAGTFFDINSFFIDDYYIEDLSLYSCMQFNANAIEKYSI